MALSADQQALIAHRLRELGATLPCPRCAGTSFALIGELGTVPVDSAAAVPVALLMCNQCGFLSTHALSTLGLAEAGLT